jgi:hypothetical protein
VEGVPYRLPGVVGGLLQRMACRNRALLDGVTRLVRRPPDPAARVMGILFDGTAGIGPGVSARHTDTRDKGQPSSKYEAEKSQPAHLDLLLSATVCADR